MLRACLQELAILALSLALIAVLALLVWWLAPRDDGSSALPSHAHAANCRTCRLSKEMEARRR